MANLRISRNIEASVIQYIEDQLLTAGWSNINVLKGFAQVYKISLPSICVRVGNTDYSKAEIGGDSITRDVQLMIDIFGSDTGNALDLKDFLIQIFKPGCIFYNYTISNGQIQSKVSNGRLRFLDLSDTAVNFDTERDKLDLHDRFRWLITAKISTGQIE